MAQSVEANGGETPDEEHAPRPSAAGLALCAGLALASALAALYQWMQLAAARDGGNPFFGLGEAWGPACAAVRSSDLSAIVQTVSGMPISGWGLVWSLVAFALPLLALMRRARDGVSPVASSPVWPAVLLTALAGLVVVGVLAFVSIGEGGLCAPCAVSHALVLSYALVAFFETKPAELGSIYRGISLASGGVALAYVLLFVPGLLTPERTLPSARFARNVLPTTPAAEAARASRNEAALEELLGQIRGPRRREFAAALQLVRDAEQSSPGEARALIGARNAPVRLTVFTDINCKLCATLHSTIARLRSGLPLRSFAVDPRYFPNDPACNPTLEGEPGENVRCLAARAQICAEGQPDALAFTSSLYRNARRLDAEGIHQMALPMIPRSELEACIASPETEAKLQADIAVAASYGIEEPPLVVLNGRKTPPYGPLLYALVLTEGDPFHPALADMKVESLAPAQEDESPEEGETTDAGDGGPPGGEDG